MHWSGTALKTVTGQTKNTDTMAPVEVQKTGRNKDEHLVRCSLYAAVNAHQKWTGSWVLSANWCVWEQNHPEMVQFIPAMNELLWKLEIMFLTECQWPLVCPSVWFLACSCLICFLLAKFYKTLRSNHGTDSQSMNHLTVQALDTL